MRSRLLRAERGSKGRGRVSRMRKALAEGCYGFPALLLVDRRKGAWLRKKPRRERARHDAPTLRPRPPPPPPPPPRPSPRPPPLPQLVGGSQTIWDPHPFLGVPLQELSTQHPTLTRLLPRLLQALGPDGTSAALQSRLQQAEAALALQRGAWLRWDALRRVLLRDPPPELEEAWTAAELRRGDPSFSSSAPPKRYEAPERLLPPLELRLRRVCAQLAAYHRPDDVTPGADDVTAGAADVTSAPLEALKEERGRLERARRRHRHLEGRLEQQRRLYPQVLQRCRALLERLAGPGVSGAWGELDGRRGDYLRAKAMALLLKIRMEELRLLLDTYTPEKLEAHRRIREGLEGAAQRAAASAASGRAALAEFRALGPEFARLASDYGELRRRLGQRRWDMEQLSLQRA